MPHPEFIQNQDKAHNRDTEVYANAVPTNQTLQNKSLEIATVAIHVL